MVPADHVAAKDTANGCASMSDSTEPMAEQVDPRPPFRAVAQRLAWVAGLVALDLWSKAFVFARIGQPWRPIEGAPVTYDLHGHPREELVGQWLAFMTSLNPGMAWGFDGLPTHVLVYGRGAAVLLLIWLLARNPVRLRLMTFAFALVLAGAVGNLHDNVFTTYEGRPFGKVRDFIDVYFAHWDWHFPTFNVADSCISVGAVLLLAGSWRKDRARALRS